ncbi:troponin, partial [Clostridium perfringens]|nr:troponin [Clostridium perfringens]
MQKAAEDLKAQQEREAEEKKKIIAERIPKLDIDNLNDDELAKKVKDLHHYVSSLEEEKYDWEVKLRRQDYEINELTIKVNDIKGKFVKPVLKKVSKTETKMSKFDRAEKPKSM